MSFFSRILLRRSESAPIDEKTALNNSPAGAAPPSASTAEIAAAQAADKAKTTDIVTEAVQAAKDEGKPTAADVDKAKAIMGGLRRVGDLPETMEKLLAFVSRFPGDERFQAFVARALERVQDPRAFAVWRGIDARFPNSNEAFLRVLRWSVRLNGLGAGEALLEERFPEEPLKPDTAFIYGRCHLELQHYGEAESIFSRIVEMDNAPNRVLISLGRIYVEMREHSRAREIFLTAAEKFGSTPAITRELARLDSELLSLDELSSDGGKAGALSGNQLISAAIEAAGAGREAIVRRRAQDFVGPVVLINGSLGSGGAERQFVNTAIGLHSACETGEQLAGRDIVGPITVICRSLHSRHGADFFEPELARAGLRVREYADFPEYGGRPRHSKAKDFLVYLPHLPAQMQDGVLRLADTLAYIGPDIVHIWQDGSVMATGLAALIARVPRIVLGVRTLPPRDRFERNKPEYEAIYRSLLAQPGVSLIANSHVAARRYEEWLGLRAGEVRVIHNGLSILQPAGSERSREMWDAFNTAQGTTFTVGSVMRFDENKRPLLWLKAAAEVATRCPVARFVMVGDGPLLPKARETARTLGIADRVLFVGRSSDVGFWLSKLDVFLLLSRHEGLPNVLIEAQMAGVPVVTTPAGGAVETLEPRITGTLLESLDQPGVTEIADALLWWRRDTSERMEMAAQIAEFAQDRFSLERMLEQTVETYLD